MAEIQTGTEQGQNVVAEAPTKPAPVSSRALRANLRTIFPAGYFARMQYCHDQGIDARISGQFRVSPYYEDLDADVFWYAGFDGLSYETAIQLFRGETAAPSPSKDNA